MQGRITWVGLGCLMLAGLAGVAAAEPAQETKAPSKSDVCCPPGQQDCQVGADAHICWPEARRCPEAGSSRDFPKCRPNQKWCQVGIDDYICWPVSKPCPVPKAAGRIDCDAGWKKCQVSEHDYICVPEADECPEPESKR